MTITVSSLATALAFSALCLVVASGAPTFEQITTFDLAHPSFMHVVDAYLPTNNATADVERTPTPVLLVTQFGLGKGHVSYLTDISSGSFSSDNLHQIPIDFIWPNDVKYYAPGEVLANDDVLVVPDGFLPPGKSTGSLDVVVNPFGGSSAKRYHISKPKNAYFYHHAIFRDMNGDGLLDLLTARATDPVLGKAGGEMVWFESPKSGSFADEWTEHVLCQGPEVLFLVTNNTVFNQKLDNSSYFVVSPQFFTKKLQLFEIRSSDNRVKSSCEIDPDIGPAYDVHLVDINNDGRLDLFASNHVGGDGGSVTAYEFPDQPGCNFKKHVLATGFKVTEGGPNQAAPGIMISFSLEKSKRPAIALGGDGSQEAYFLDPVGDTGFNYTKTVITKQDGVVGTVTGGRVLKGGSQMTLFAPNYDRGKVLWYRLIE